MRDLQYEFRSISPNKSSFGFAGVLFETSATNAFQRWGCGGLLLFLIFRKYNIIVVFR